MSEVRLIDANALKELEPHHSEDGYRVFYEYEIDNAPTVNPYFPFSEEAIYKITDAEWEHSDNFWITTPSGKKIEFEKKRPQGEWLEIPVERDLLYNTGIKYTCSICGRGNCYGKPPFCMYCGAAMGGKEK